MTSVYLIIDPKFNGNLMGDNKFPDIWIVDSLQNEEYIKNLPYKPASVTWIQVKSNENSSEIFMRILDSLDQHHNELAQNIPYDSLVVYGLGEAEECINFARIFGFKSELITDERVIFLK